MRAKEQVRHTGTLDTEKNFPYGKCVLVFALLLKF